METLLDIAFWALVIGLALLVVFVLLAICVPNERWVLPMFRKYTRPENRLDWSMDIAKEKTKKKRERD